MSEYISECTDTDSFYVNLKGLEQWAEREQNPVSRAVLNSLVASIYANYADNNRWELRQRTSLDLEDEALPADIREWSGNLFMKQVMKYTGEALKDSAELLKTSSRTYIPFVILGDASEYYHHEMYHCWHHVPLMLYRKFHGSRWTHW